MKKRGKKRTTQRDGSASKLGDRSQSDTPRRRVKRRRYVIWSMCGLAAVAVAVVAWTVVEDESPKTSAPTYLNQLPATLPAEKLATTKSDLKSSAEVAAPQMTIPETEFDFGFVPQYAKISHVFWLHSTGNDTLKILQVSPG